MDTRPKRGLGALLSSTTQPGHAPEVTLAEVPLNTIRRNPAQPRTEFDPIALQELADSIKSQGIIQPIAVRPLKPEETHDHVRYELIAGERRWRASQIAGLTVIPIVIKHVFDERDILVMSLVENLQRDDLNPIEEALAYDKLGKSLNFTHEQIANGVGKSRAHVSNLVRLLELPSTILDALKSKKLSTAHAKILLSIPDPKLQSRYAAKTQAENLTVKDLERLTLGSNHDSQKSPDSPTKSSTPRQKGTRGTRLANPETQDLERRLREHFGTKVQIEEGLRKSRLIIEFYSPADFQRILSMLEIDL